MNDVDKYINELSPELGKLTQSLRELIKRTLPQASEKLKWGNPSYLLDKQIICSICVYKNHINLEFWKGSTFNSPFLEGTGKNLRHIKIFDQKDIEDKKLAHLIKSAIKHS